MFTRLWNHHQYLIQNISIIPKETLYPLVTSFLFPLSQATTNLFSASMHLAILYISYKWNLMCLTFTLFLRFIHVVACNSTLSLFIAKYLIFMDTPHFDYSSVDSYLVISTFGYNTSNNNHVQVLVWTWLSFLLNVSMYLGVESLGDTIFNFLKNCQASNFSTTDKHFTSYHCLQFLLVVCPPS